ncbi:MAG TPA: branched-chain amino acid ABC transporter permease [Mycobacteriales bacterium]|nr:branched-chain amino acid ABC transporter permease [Mycobacteriales bacterium]
MTAPRLTARIPRPALPDVIGTMGRQWEKLPWYGKYVVYALLVVGAVILPADSIGKFMTPDSDWSAVLFYPIGVYVLLAIGLNVVVGQAGLLDLGYVAFFAIGGYSMGILGAKHHWDFWAVLPAGIAIAAVSGVILGAPTLRLRGDYLAIVTLGFGEIIRISANNADSFTGGPRGISPIPHPPGSKSIKALNYNSVLDTKPYYYLVLVMIVLVIIMVKRLERSRVGRAWAAIREDEDAAELMGVPTFKYKIWAFAMGASIGGAAGVLFASQTISLTPTNFPFILSALILVAVVLGGSGNLPGVIIGAFLVAWLPERFRGFAEYRVLIFGAALVIMMIIRPEGLLPSRRRRAELAEGTGGMGTLGAEVGAVATQVVEPDVLVVGPDDDPPGPDRADRPGPGGQR